MKLVAFILLIIVPAICCGQTVHFKLYRTKACSTVEKLDSSYSLYKVGDSLNTYYQPKSGIVQLPGPGIYKIYFFPGPVTDTIFNIHDTGLFVVKYKEPNEGLYDIGAFDTPPLYYRCDSLLNGYQEYHYPNGTLKMHGTFRNGSPKDSIVHFYPTGKMRKRVLISPKIVLIEEFDEAGNKKRVEHNQNKSFMEYWEHRWEDFFPDGRLKRIETSIKRVVRITEFYPGGQLKIKQTKKNRLEYYENGQLKVSYVWKNTTKGKRDRWMTYTVYKVEYDQDGQLLRSEIFEEWGYIIAQPKLDIKDSDLIVKIEEFKAGKVAFSIKNMDTKDYLKKYPND